MSWPATWLPVLRDLGAGGIDEHRPQLDALAEARRDGAAGIAEFEETLGDLAAAPDVLVLALLLSYRGERAWDRLFTVVEQMRFGLAAYAFVRQQQAFALNRAGRGEEAEQILLALRQEAGPSPETNGILGRIYKDRFIDTREAGDHGAAEPWLRQAIDTYLEGHDADPANPYPGLNALSLMEFAFPKPARRDSLLEEVSAASRRRLLGGAPSYWDYATEWELAVIEGDEQTARAAMDRAVRCLEEPWQAASTRYNTRMLETAWVSRGVAPPDWVGPLAGRLDPKDPTDEPPPDEPPPDEPPPSPDGPPPSPGTPAPPDEPPPPSGPPAGAAAALPDLPDFVAGDREENQAQLDALIAARQQSVEGIAEYEGTLGAVTSVPDVVVTALMLAYRSEQAWDRLFALVAQMRPELASRPFVRQQHAFALNRAGRSAEAEKILLAVREEHGPSPETNGILGRVYKDWFQAARANDDEETAGNRLQQAIDTYLEGHDADPSNPYPGLNALSLMEFAYPRPARRDQLRDEVTAASRRRLLRDGPDYWDYATEWELAVLDGDELTAGAAMKRTTERVAEPWQAASTSYNTQMLQAARVDRDLPVPEWVGPAAARLDAITPSGGAPKPWAGPPAPATPPGGPDGTRAAPDETEPEVPPASTGETPATPADTAEPEAPPAGTEDAPSTPADTVEPEAPPAGTEVTPAKPADTRQPEPPLAGSEEGPATPDDTAHPEAPPTDMGETPTTPSDTAEPDTPRSVVEEPPPGPAEEAVSSRRPRKGFLGGVKRLVTTTTKVVVVGAAATTILGAAIAELYLLFSAEPHPGPWLKFLNLYSLGLLPGLLVTLFTLRGVPKRFRHALALWIPLPAWLVFEDLVWPGSPLGLLRRLLAGFAVEAQAVEEVAFLVLSAFFGLLVGLTQAWWLRSRRRRGTRLTLAEHYKGLVIGVALAAAFAFLF